MTRYRNNRTIGGVNTSYFDVLSPIPNFWIKKAHNLISNWNTDGSADMSGHKATSAIVTTTEVILYTYGGREIFRMTR